MSKAFISYSWDSDEHKEWVRTLAIRLRSDGVETVLDQWHLIPGDQLPAFMEKAIRESDYVLIVCTPHYKEKSERRLGGVGYEGDIITGQVLTTRNERKFIPILRNGKWIDAAPTWLVGKYHVDLRKEPYYESHYLDLITTMLGTREQSPPVRKAPKRTSQKSTLSPTTTPQQSVIVSNTQNSGIIANIINIKGKKSHKYNYPLNSIGADNIKTNYIHYLYGRYIKFREADPSFGASVHAKHFHPAELHHTIYSKFKAKTFFIHITRFDELVYYIQGRIDKTIMGKTNHRQNIPNYDLFEAFRLEQLGQRD